MDVDGVLPGHDRLLPLLKLHGNGATVRTIREAGGPYRVALSVLKLCCSPRSLSSGNFGRGCDFPDPGAAFLSGCLALPGGSPLEACSSWVVSSPCDPASSSSEPAVPQARTKPNTRRARSTSAPSTKSQSKMPLEDFV